MNLLFRADGAERIGTGHVMRCLTLASRWREGGQEAVFAAAVCTPALERRIRALGCRFELISCNIGSLEDASATVAVARRICAGAVIVDGYSFSAEWHSVLRDAGLRTLLLNDDPNVGCFAADLVLNQNASAHADAYAFIKKSSKLLLGARYALLRPEFVEKRRIITPVAPSVRRVLVTMGGSDPHNVSSSVAEAIFREPIDIRIIAGGSNPWIPQLQAFARKSDANIEVLVDVPDMAEHMAWADLAITAAGSTSLELACLGVPTLYIITAENQRLVAEAMANLGVGLNLGWHADLGPTEHAAAIRSVQDRGRRAAMRERGLALVDGYGVERVLLELRKTLIALRPAAEQDCRLVWEWVNDAQVRLMSFSREPIPWKDHVTWWVHRVTSGAPGFYVAQLGTERIGYVRFDPGETGRATVSLALAPPARGKRLGAAMLDAACERAIKERLASCFDAYIQPENHSSIRCFEAAGFSRVGTAQVKGHTALSYLRFSDREGAGKVPPC